MSSKAPGRCACEWYAGSSMCGWCGDMIRRLNFEAGYPRTSNRVLEFLLEHLHGGWFVTKCYVKREGPALHRYRTLFVHENPHSCIHARYLKTYQYE